MGYRFYSSGKIMPAGVIAVLRYLDVACVGIYALQVCTNVEMIFQRCYGRKNSYEILLTTLEDSVNVKC